MQFDLSFDLLCHLCFHYDLQNICKTIYLKIETLLKYSDPGAPLLLLQTI